MDSPTDDSKKRRRGATRLSCAECRRLKLRCDRTVPCSSCVKRGCSAICPDGSLTTGQGNRFVLASTTELHTKITDLSNRVRSLEDALRDAHAHMSSEPHPLLAEELLRIKHPLERDAANGGGNGSGDSGPASPMKKEEASDGAIVDAVGSLSVADGGRTKFFGHSANSWLFLRNEEPDEGDQDDRHAELREHLPPQIINITGTFPTNLLSSTSQMPKNLLESIYWFLPNAEKAIELRDNYYQYAAWMYNPIPPDEFEEEIFTPFYKTGVASLDEPHLAHRLAVLFMVLAIGSQVDPALSAHNLEAEKFHLLARASLFGSRITDQPTVRAVQALYLMVFYQFLEDPFINTPNSRWAMMGMAVKLAQSIGLHRDSGRFHMEATEVRRRRDLFIELYVYDSWMALTLGRPPSISSAHYDVRPPSGEDGLDPASSAFHRWKYLFTTECLSELHDKAFGATVPTYKTVTMLDRKLRAHPVPEILQITPDGQAELTNEPPALTLQRHTVVLIRESNLLYLHRNFFARAITDYPDDPLGSPHGPSVIAAYRSAWSLTTLVRNLHTSLTHPTDRLWFAWSNLFSCVIVLGSIVTRCPSLALAPSALVQLDTACELFGKVAQGFRADKVLNVMLRLREKAHVSLANFRAGKTPGGHPSLALPNSPLDDREVDELTTLGGSTRLVHRASSLSPNSDSSLKLSAPGLSPTSASRVVPVPLYNRNDPQADVHPSVLDYIRTFAPHKQNHAQHVHPQQQAPQPHTYSAMGVGHMNMTPITPASVHSAYGELAPPMGSMAPSTHATGSMVPHGQGSTDGYFHSPTSATAPSSAYPQYVPVFEYPPPGMEQSFPPLPVDNAPPPHSSESPHGEWNSFVAQFKLGM